MVNPYKPVGRPPSALTTNHDHTTREAHVFLWSGMKGISMTISSFKPECLPLLIGSLPMTDHREAQELVLRHTPEIPLWVQLPSYREEGMVAQFLPGLPGAVVTPERIYVDNASETFDAELLSFYEDYMTITEAGGDLETGRFALSEKTARGFFTLLDLVPSDGTSLSAVKGQITGPFTFATGLVDSRDRAIFYDSQLRDAAVKLISLKARWQVRQLKRFGKPVIIFFDEPGLTGFGSSAFISVSREDITECLAEVIQAVHDEGGLAGIHVCANADWSLVLDSPADVASFDAYSYFDRFILYPERIKRFLAHGKLLAWGIVPTMNAEDIEKETTASLTAAWQDKVRQVEALGIDPSVIRAQSFITPSCGTGSLHLTHAQRVLRLTRAVSETIREQEA